MLEESERTILDLILKVTALTIASEVVFALLIFRSSFSQVLLLNMSLVQFSM